LREISKNLTQRRKGRKKLDSRFRGNDEGAGVGAGRFAAVKISQDIGAIGAA
jgi:hypothetical protein